MFLSHLQLTHRQHINPAFCISYVSCTCVVWKPQQGTRHNPEPHELTVSDRSHHSVNKSLIGRSLGWDGPSTFGSYVSKPKSHVNGEMKPETLPIRKHQLTSE